MVLTNLLSFEEKYEIIAVQIELREIIMKVIEVNIKDVREFRAGFELVEYEAGTDPMDGFCLMGFDEVGMFCANPRYAFLGA